jgi:hypothetical protein
MAAHPRRVQREPEDAPLGKGDRGNERYFTDVEEARMWLEEV